MTKTESNNLKQAVRRQGYKSLREWSEKHNYKYRDVSDVVRGVRRGQWGIGREICQQLGINPDA